MSNKKHNFFPPFKQSGTTSLIIICLCLLNGCASVSTEIVGENDHGINDGIVYYMPKRPIRINVGVEKPTPPSKKMMVTITLVGNVANDTMPDMSQQYLLRYNKSWVSKNHMFMSVNKMGLLSVSHGDTVSRVNDILTNVAQDVATASLGAGITPNGSTKETPALAPHLEPPGENPSYSDKILAKFETDKNCSSGSYLISPEASEIVYICEGLYKIKIAPGFTKCSLKASKRLPSNENCSNSNSVLGILDQIDNLSAIENITGFANNLAHLNLKAPKLPGLFYKQELPYYVTVTDSTIKELGEQKLGEQIAYSPNESKIYFAPIRKTLFTDNTSDITLANGVIQTFEETTDSELLGISKLPANILGSYTGAIGEVFQSLKANYGYQKETNDSAREVAFTLQKLKNCQLAIATNNIEGKTGEELSTMRTNIQNACSNN